MACKKFESAEVNKRETNSLLIYYLKKHLPHDIMASIVILRYSYMFFKCFGVKKAKQSSVFLRHGYLLTDMMLSGAMWSRSGATKLQAATIAMQSHGNGMAIHLNN